MKGAASEHDAGPCGLRRDRSLVNGAKRRAAQGSGARAGLDGDVGANGQSTGRKLYIVKARTAENNSAGAANGLRADGSEIRKVVAAGDGERAIER